MVIELASDPKASSLQATSPSALDSFAGWANEDRGLWRWARLLPVITGIAAALIVAAVGFRLWLASVGSGELVVWAVGLLVLAVLAYLSQHLLDRNHALQAERQASLLRAISDIGEGLVITESGRFVAGNAAYEALTGYDSTELAALPSLIELAPPEERQHLTDQLATRLEGGEVPYRYESALIRKDGRQIQVETAVRPLAAEGKHRLLALVHDISERHRMEEAERESETRFRTLFEQAQAGMAFAVLDSHITTVNPAFRELVGYGDAELHNLSLLDITHADDVAAVQEALSRMIGGAVEGTRIEMRYTRRDGEPVWVDVTTRLVRGPDGKPMYLQTGAVNIRDRKRAEVLQAARFAVTQALVTSPGWEKAAPGVLEGLCRALDWELAEYWEVDPERETMHFVTAWKRPGRDTSSYEITAAQSSYRRGEGLAGKVWETGAPVSVPDVAADDSPRSVAAVAARLRGIVGFPVRSGRRVVGMIGLHTWAPRELDEGLLAVMSDVGSQVGEFVERKRAEIALQESEKRMRSVLDNVSDGLATIEQSGIIESAKPSLLQVFGFSEPELVGQQADVLIATTHRSAFANYLERRLKLDIPVSGGAGTVGRARRWASARTESCSRSSSSSARCRSARDTCSSQHCATSPSAKLTPTR